MKATKLTQITGLLMLAGALNLQAASGSWTNDASSVWSATTNWLAGTVADASGSTADFSTINITASRTVTLDAAHTLTTLKFGDTIPDYNWTLTGANTLTLAGTTPTINVVNQGVTISSVIAGTVGLTKYGLGALTLGGATETFTGGVSVNEGTLTLDYNASGSPTSTLVPSQALTLGGGKLNINGNAGTATSQAFSGLTLNAGFSGLSVAPAAGESNPTLTFGNITYNTGATIVFNGLAYNNAVTTSSGQDGSGLQAATATITATTGGGINTLLSSFGSTGTSYNAAYATVGLYDFAGIASAASPYSFAGLSTLSGGTAGDGAYVLFNAANLATGNIACDILGACTASGTTSPSCIRFNAPGASLNTGAAVFSVAGVLVTPNVGTNNVAYSGNLGPGLRNANQAGSTVIWQNNTLGYLNFAAGTLGDSRKGGAAFVKAGSGTVNIQGASSYTGVTYVNGGTWMISSNSSLGTPSSGQTLNLNGGTLFASQNITLDNGGANKRNITLLSNGGGLAAAAGSALTVDGVIGSAAAGTGPLVVGIPASAANGSVAGLLPGSGSIANGQAVDTANTAAVFGTGTVVLNGTGNTFSGGVQIVGGATLNINSEWQLGGGVQGPVVFNNGTLQYASTLLNTTVDISVQPVTFTGNGTIDVNTHAITYANAIGNATGSGALTVLDSAGGGSLTLTGGGNFTNTTTVGDGTHAVTLNVNGLLASSGVSVASGGIVGGTGTYSGTVTVNSGGETYPSAGNGATNTIANLIYNSGALAGFNLTTNYNGSNDLVVVTGALSLNGTVHIKAPSTSVALDTNADYVLLTYGSSSGSFSSLVWDVQPVNYNAFSISNDTVNKKILLHYTPSATAPTLTGSAGPAVRNQSILVSVTVTPGSGTVSSSGSVHLNGSSIGLSSSVPLTRSTGNIFTNTITVPAGTGLGGFNLGIWVVDSTPLTGTNNFTLSINATTETWSGLGGGNWGNNADWVSTLAPGYVGDTLVFAGTTGLSPNIETNYSVTSVTFTNGSGAFTIASANGSSLTLTAGGVTNLSANLQTLNVPVTLTAAQTLNAASGPLTLGSSVTNGGNLLTVSDGGFITTISGAVSGSGGLTKLGTGTNILSGVNTYTGNTAITAGTLEINAAGQLNSGIYIGNITNNGAFIYDSSASQTLSGGIISGTGSLTLQGSGTLTLGANVGATTTYTGPTVVNGGTLGLFDGNFGNSGLYTSSGLIINNGGTVLVDFDNSLAGSTSTLGSCPVTINAGGLLINAGAPNTGAGASSHIRGLLTLNGGTLANNGTGTGTYIGKWGTWDLDDGVVVNGGTNTSTISALGVMLTQAGGTTFNVANGGTTNGIDLNVTGTLIATSGGTGAPTITRLVKTGNGTMVLGGVNTYTSATIVSNGTLRVDGSLAAGSAVTVAVGTLSGVGTINGTTAVNAGAYLVAGDAKIGTLTFNNLTLDAASTNLFVVTTLGGASNSVAVTAGTLTPNGSVIKINTAGDANLGAGTNVLFTYSAISGSFNATPVFVTPQTGLATNAVLLDTGSAIELAVANLSSVNTNPTNITAVVTGSTLSLTWPGDHLGWTLQTNSVDLANTNDWFPYPGSASVTNVDIMIDPTQTNVFFRLVYP